MAKKRLPMPSANEGSNAPWPCAINFWDVPPAARLCWKGRTRSPSWRSPPHTLETLAPSARSWSLPVVMFSQVPQQGESNATKRQLQQQRTREAAAQVLSNPTWAGGTVVMAWEHRTIANQQLAERFPEQPVTLRQLLNLDQLPDVPDTWPDDTYGWIWIIDYDNAPSPIPTGFRMVREAFAAPYSHLKAPAWGTPVPQADGCLP